MNRFPYPPTAYSPFGYAGLRIFMKRTGWSRLTGLTPSHRIVATYMTNHNV